MRFLYVTTIGGTMTFFRRLVKELIQEGHTVDIAANIGITDVPREYYELGCIVYKLSCVRTPFDKGNLASIKQLQKISKKRLKNNVHSSWISFL